MFYSLLLIPLALMTGIYFKTKGNPETINIALSAFLGMNYLYETAFQKNNS